MALDWIHHNLHTGRVSVRPAGQPGGKRRVTITADAVVVRNATPHVSAAGRARVVEKGSRDVHATIRGTAVTVADGGSQPVPLPGARHQSAMSRGAGINSDMMGHVMAKLLRSPPNWGSGHGSRRSARDPGL